MMKTHISYIKTFLLTSLTIGFIIFLFVLSVDPYDKLGINVWNLENKAVSAGGNFKYSHIENVEKNEYQIFILGSSNANHYDPELIEELTGLKAYNYCVHNAQTLSYLAIVRHLIDKQVPKIIILNLDFFNLNENLPSDIRLIRSPIYKYLINEKIENKFDLLLKTYFSWKSFSDAWRLVYYKFLGKKIITHKKNGAYIYEFPPKLIETNFRYFEYEYKDFKIGDKNILHLEKIRKLAHHHNIKLIVTLGAINMAQIKEIKKRKQLYETFKSYKELSANIFGKVFDFSNESVAFYNGFPYGLDAVHPSSELSNIIVQKIFSSDSVDAPLNFGKILHSNSNKGGNN
ncbi:hypothetical protein DID80_04900 [Candidatus Marinamargulisbacteria bacterium SCGC AAA071-K20]|nr:hypothetical protein DID80_04900 [Candidatus Marinamargulisbacteria bacterium SCGC AAA071-K20]